MAVQWWERAMCAGQPAELFFSNGRQGSTPRQAHELCRRCPVTQSCLREALAVETEAVSGPYGFRAGMTASQRRRIMRARRSGESLAGSGDPQVPAPASG